MSDLVKFPLVLGTVAVVSAAMLAGLYELTKPEIERRAREKEALAERIALPAAAFTRPDTVELASGTWTFKRGYDRDPARGGRLVGYIARGSAYGYSSWIELLVGVRTDRRIASIQVLSQKETPGLGTRVEEAPARRTWADEIAAIFGGGKRAEGAVAPPRPWFQAQFDGRARDELRLDVDGGPIQAISGATITSRAVLDAVAEALDRLDEALAGAKRGT